MQSQDEILPLEFYYIHDSNGGQKALGKIGLKLVDFVRNVDQFHPETLEVFMSIFSNDKTFLAQVAELFKLTHHLEHISNLSGLVDKKKLSKSFIKSDTFAIRLMQKDKRELLRKRKETQIVDLTKACKNIDWDNCKNNFSEFERFKNPYKEEIQAYEKKALRYLELGLKISGDKVASNINKIRNNEVYYGFNRVNISYASFILAKQSGYRLRTTYDLYDCKSCRIIIPGNKFKLETGYDYGPRAYPLHEMICIAPDNVLKSVDNLENFPEANGKAIFDNFIVLVPGPSYADAGVDRMLIQNSYICPILIGEKDSKCFFISSWR